MKVQCITLSPTMRLFGFEIGKIYPVVKRGPYLRVYSRIDGHSVIIKDLADGTMRRNAKAFKIIEKGSL